MSPLCQKTLQTSTVDNTAGEITGSSFASTGAPLRWHARKVGLKTEMESLTHDWGPEPDWWTPNMEGSEVKSPPGDSILIKEDKIALPNQNLESSIPQRKSDEPSAANAGGGSVESGTGVHVELKGSPLT